MISRRSFLRAVCLGAASGFASSCSSQEGGPSEGPNILLLTADDMSWDTPGCYGGAAPGITPRIDALAASGTRFLQAYVNVSACQASRAVLLTGLYPHRNGVTGFEASLLPQAPTLSALLSASGYETALLGKEEHYRPPESFRWDTSVGVRETRAGRDPAAFASWTELVIRKARAAKRPFFIHANSHDPHRPFHGSVSERRMDLGNDAPYPPPSRVYAPGEVRVPGFLPDLPPVREEIAQYCSSARRADDMVGAVLDVLDAEGVRDRTLVVFLSDNAMSFPFAKACCYMAGTRTPLVVSWPGRIAAGRADAAHYVSTVDLAPTLLEIAAPGLLPQHSFDGRSFAPLLEGGSQPGREELVSMYHSTLDRRSYEMRAFRRGRWGYIWNPWSDGSTRFSSESQSGLSMAAMAEAARSNPALAERVQRFLFRVPEELYDYEEDPDALRNRAGDPAHAERLARMRKGLGRWMRRYADPLAGVFAERIS